MKNIFIFLFFLSLLGCKKEDTTVYNNYNGSPNDSTGYINVFYHNFEPDIVLDSESIFQFSRYNIDFNNDNEDDFSFYWDRFRNQICIDGGHIIVETSCHKIDSVKYGPSPGGVNIVERTIPSALDSGFLVQSILDLNYRHWQTKLLSQNSSIYPFAFFESSSCSLYGKEFFIGMKSAFNSSSYTNYAFNYGWMRISVSSDGKTITLKDYAYNIIPNSPIRVGDK